MVLSPGPTFVIARAALMTIAHVATSPFTPPAIFELSFGVTLI